MPALAQDVHWELGKPRTHKRSDANSAGSKNLDLKV